MHGYVCKTIVSTSPRREDGIMAVHMVLGRCFYLIFIGACCTTGHIAMGQLFIEIIICKIFGASTAPYVILEPIFKIVSFIFAVF